jgi:hypothetical protein
MISFQGLSISQWCVSVAVGCGSRSIRQLVQDIVYETRLESFHMDISIVNVCMIQ